MKRIMIITAMLAAISLSLQAGPKVEMKTSGPSGQGDLIWWAPSTGVTNLRMTVNGLTYITLYETPTIYDLTLLGNLIVTTNATVGGKTTCNGELEVNNSDVDINMTLSANEIDITQTNAAGTASTPLIAVTDARTGSTANEASEASLVITAAGAYGLSVADGIVNIEGEIDSTGDITLDPGGDDVICDGTVDATAYTADAGAGLDVKTGGALKLGVTTATSVDIGVISTMTTVKGTLNVDQAVTLDSSLDVTGDATVLGGDVIGAKTNSIDIGEIADGQITLKRSNSGTVTLTSLDDDANAALTIEAGGNGALKLGATDSTTEISSSDWTISTAGVIAGCDMSAAQLTAGSVASAIDGSAITNIPAAAIQTMQTGQLIIGDSDGVGKIATMGGDGTILANGTFSINNKAVQANDIEIVGGQILIGDAGATGVCVAVSGDLTMNSTGAFTVANGAITAAKIDPTVVTNVLAGGMVLPAVDGSAVTNIAGGNIASGNIAAARIATALGTSGGSIGGNIPAAALTNACGVGAVICVVTNLDANGTTNICTFFGTVSYP